MKTSIVMPQLGLTMTEGTVSQWLKKPGDNVRKDEPLFVVSTDKVDMEVESPIEGTLEEVIIGAGQAVPVGTTLAYVSGRNEEASTSGQNATQLESAPTTLAPASLTQEMRQIDEPGRDSASLPRRTASASPRARRLATKLGVDLSTVKGSGRGGRIVEDDVRRAVGNPPKEVDDSATRRRKLIADRMTLSIQTIPHFGLSAHVNAEKLIAVYESLRAKARESSKLRVTITDLLLRALGFALRNVPELNVSWRDGQIHPRTSIDLGFAAATDRGVVAPVIREADRITFEELIARRTELVEKARAHQLAISDLEGGVGTLSNLGMYRVDQCQAIISPDQSFVLAVGRICKRPWVDSSLVIRSTINLNLSVDHRLADGASAAILLEKIADFIETPARLFLRVPRGQTQ